MTNLTHKEMVVLDQDDKDETRKEYQVDLTLATLEKDHKLSIKNPPREDFFVLLYVFLLTSPLQML